MNTKSKHKIGRGAFRIFLIGFMLFCFLACSNMNAQDRNIGINYSDTLKKGRLIGVTASTLSAYTATMIAVNTAWYQQYERTTFHFHNDANNWLQMDKIGHAWTANAESIWGVELLRWTGLEDKKAIWIGASAAWFFQASIELLDGFSAEWGASLTDLAANTIGSGMVVAQELAWQEQRVLLKFSFHPVDYSDYPIHIQDRAGYLYGSAFQEKLLKDYNGQTYWLSANPHAFGAQKIPPWLNIAFGYGSQNVFGAIKNEWENADGQSLNAFAYERQRQYYLSLDIDLSRIKTRSRTLNTVLGAFNVLKIPAPTIGLNSNGQWRFYPIYF